MNSVVETDVSVKYSLKLLHACYFDSAGKIRLVIDEIIKQRCSNSSKNLSKKISDIHLVEEINFPGCVKQQKTSESFSSTSCQNVDASISLPHEIKNVGLTLNLVDIKDMDVTEQENLKDFGDLACVVCGAMVIAAGNRLIECADCHSLYHQECHKPYISDIDANEQEFSWCCSSCKNKIVLGKISGALSSQPSSKLSSHSSSSSSSSSSHYKRSNEHISSNSSKHRQSNSKSKHSSHSSSHSSHSSKSTQPSLSGTSFYASGSSVTTSFGSKVTLPPITPNINIVSADKRIQIMKKKAAKQQETKRKHK